MLSRPTPDKLLERVAAGWNRSTIAAGGPDHFADVKVTVRIEAKIVRREEVARGARIRASSPARQELAP
jgi:hypothetical protein